MKPTRQARREATQLFRSCHVKGLLDENGARQAAQRLMAEKPRGYLGTLSLFSRLVKLELARRSARVESAVPLPGDLQAAVQSGLNHIYGAGLTTCFVANPALIAGMRIQVGSDVYDGTVQGRLNALQQRF